MTIEIETRARRSKRRHKPNTKYCSTAALLDANGKPCPAPGIGYPSYMHFRMRDGTELYHANNAIVRAGRCPHCFCDNLADVGFFDSYQDEALICRFDFDGGGRNGKDLLAVLSALGLPRVSPLNLFDEGGRA